MEMTKIRELVQEKHKEKSVEKGKGFSKKTIIKATASLAVGFMLMNPFVLGELSPFAISFLSSTSGICCATAGVGTVIGSLMFFDGVTAVRYIASAIICIVIKILCTKYVSEKFKSKTSYINAFASVFLIGTAINCATVFDMEIFVTDTYEALLCCIGSFVFDKGVELIFSKKEIGRFTTGEYIILIFAFCTILTPLYKYSFMEFSPIGVIFALLILTAGKLKNGIGGAVMGICIGMSLGLSGEIGFMSAGYGLAGLVCGEYARRDKFHSVAGYIIPVVISAFVDGSVKSYVTIAEGVSACIIFIIIPEKAFERLSEKVNVAMPVFVINDNSRLLSKKLSDASDAIVEVSDCVDNVQKTLASTDTDKLVQIVRIAWDNVCAQCELNENCRNEIKIPASETIDKIAHALKNNAPIDETKFPKDFPSSCYCFDTMCAKLQEKYINYLACVSADGKINQMQGMLSEQFKSMADILREIACDFDSETNENPQVADIISAEALEAGLSVLSANSVTDKFGRYEISVEVIRPDDNFNISRFTDNLSIATGTKLGLPCIAEHGGTCIMNFSQTVVYSAEVGAFSRSADDVQVCGDYYQSFRDENSRIISVLSDGMGTGNRAAVDSAMAAELFSKLIKSGLSFDCALPIANSALLVKSSEETLSTLDVVCIDLYSGKTEFMKAGAAATFIRHREKIAALEQASLPIGILRDVKFSKAVAKLSAGDIIVMVSDGVLCGGNSWIQHELKFWDTRKPPRELAEFIVNSACERITGEHRDDMTAIAIYIS